MSRQRVQRPLTTILGRQYLPRAFELAYRLSALSIKRSSPDWFDHDNRPLGCANAVRILVRPVHPVRVPSGIFDADEDSHTNDEDGEVTLAGGPGQWSCSTGRSAEI